MAKKRDLDNILDEFLKDPLLSFVNVPFDMDFYEKSLKASLEGYGDASKSDYQHSEFHVHNALKFVEYIISQSRTNKLSTLQIEKFREGIKKTAKQLSAFSKPMETTTEEGVVEVFEIDPEESEESIRQKKKLVEQLMKLKAKQNQSAIHRSTIYTMLWMHDFYRGADIDNRIYSGGLETYTDARSGREEKAAGATIRKFQDHIRNNPLSSAGHVAESRFKTNNEEIIALLSNMMDYLQRAAREVTRDAIVPYEQEAQKILKKVKALVKTNYEYTEYWARKYSHQEVGALEEKGELGIFAELWPRFNYQKTLQLIEMNIEWRNKRFLGSLAHDKWQVTAFGPDQFSKVKGKSHTKNMRVLEHFLQIANFPIPDSVTLHPDTITEFKDFIDDWDSYQYFLNANLLDYITFIRWHDKKYFIPISLDGKISKDADILEALGPKAVTRTFRVGHVFGNKFYRPEINTLKNRLVYFDGTERSVLKDMHGPVDTIEVIQTLNYLWPYCLNMPISRWLVNNPIKRIPKDVAEMFIVDPIARRDEDKSYYQMLWESENKKKIREEIYPFNIQQLMEKETLLFTERKMSSGEGDFANLVEGDLAKLESLQNQYRSKKNLNIEKKTEDFINDAKNKYRGFLPLTKRNSLSYDIFLRALGKWHGGRLERFHEVTQAWGTGTPSESSEEFAAHLGEAFDV